VIVRISNFSRVSVCVLGAAAVSGCGQSDVSENSHGAVSTFAGAAELRQPTPPVPPPAPLPPTSQEGSDKGASYTANVFAGEGILVLHDEAAKLLYGVLTKSKDRPAVAGIEKRLLKDIKFADNEFREGKDLFCVKLPVADAAGLKPALDAKGTMITSLSCALHFPIKKETPTGSKGDADRVKSGKGNARFTFAYSPMFNARLGVFVINEAAAAVMAASADKLKPAVADLLKRKKGQINLSDLEQRSAAKFFCVHSPEFNADDTVKQKDGKVVGAWNCSANAADDALEKGELAVVNK
jgi:hypothetical protein